MTEKVQSAEQETTDEQMTDEPAQDVHDASRQNNILTDTGITDETGE